MGFRVDPTIYVLEFDGSDLSGLVVKMTSLSVAEYAKMMHLISAEGSTEEAAEANEEIILMFTKSLRSWNLEGDDGKPVPANLENVQKQEQRLITRIFTAWQRAMNEVSADLEKDLSSGVTMPEESLGLAGQSVSLPSGLKAS